METTPTVKLVPGGETYLDAEAVTVEPGSEADKLWRERGYLTEAELVAQAEPESTDKDPEPKRGPGRPKAEK